MIVVGVDGSESSKDALRWASRQSKLTGTSLEVVTAWKYPVEWGWVMTYDENFDPEGQARRDLQTTVDEVLGSGSRVPLSVVEGNPAQVLLDAAKDAELLVVGSHGRGQFAGMVLGSVSQHCVHHAACPVVVVRQS